MTLTNWVGGAGWLAYWEGRGLAWLGVAGDVTDLSVKVLNANLDLTCMAVQHTHTHTHTRARFHTKEDDCEVS